MPDLSYKGIRIVRHVVFRLHRRLINRPFGFPEVRSQPAADVYIVSFPKSGRTWVRAMIGKYIQELTGVTSSNVLEVYELSRDIEGIPTIAFVHDGSCYEEKNFKADRLPKSKSFYRGKRVVLLVRDPRDTLVSYYLHCSRRRHVYRGGISSFIRDEYFGIEKVISFINIWIENRHVPEDFCLVRYEDIHQNAHLQLAHLLDFMGIPVDLHIVETAVKFASFQNMREMEEKYLISSSRLTPGNPHDPESYKVRRGIVGGYKDYLSQEDIEFLTTAIKTKLSPFCGYATGE